MAENVPHSLSGPGRVHGFRLLVMASIAVIVAGYSTPGSVVLYPGQKMHGEPFFVPPGHLPPPGQCRVWFPGRPPGQQPPPGNCFELRHRVPPGAYLITR